MSLQFVAGPSGSGKSYYLYKTVIEEAKKNPDERFLFLVPEQFTMQAQKELTEVHPNHSLLNVDILSFNRLAYRVFDETGYDQAPILEDTGKILVLQKILSENRDDLELLGNMYDKVGSAAKINSLLSELTQYRIDVSKIREKQDNMPELLKRKLNDVQIISEKFSEYMKDRYLTAEEVPSVLSQVIEQYKELEGSTIVFDGFTGFVPTQMLVIEKILKMCKRVIVSVTTDRKAGLNAASSPSNLFHMTHQMVEGIKMLASETGTQLLETIRIEPSEKSRLGANKPLAFLENKLFRYEFKTYQKSQDSIRIGEAGTPKQEIETAAEIISEMVRCKGYRYRDFALVSGSLENYGELAGQIFSENKIPYFLDQKQSIMSNTAVEFLRSAIGMACDDFSYRSVFRFLKSGMTGFTGEEICMMENYVLAHGIKGYKGYLKDWDRTSNTIDEAMRVRINEIRSSFIAMIEGFITGFKVRNATVRQRTEAIYGLLVFCGIQLKCSDMSGQFQQKGELSKAKEYAQIYRMLIDFLEKLVGIMGEEKTSVELYRQMVDAGLDSMKIGIIPPNQDQVVIGDIERTRLKNIRIMFFVGLNDGIVPKPTDNVNVLSQIDRKVLAAGGIELAPDARAEMYRQRLYLYLNLTKPSEKLFLSYSKVSSGGEAQLPSYLVNVIREMFPGLEIADLDKRTFKNRIETYTGRSQLILDGFEKIEESIPGNEFLELVSFYRKDPENSRLIDDLIKAAKSSMPQTNISKEAARKLYGINNSYSASRVETFGNCEFSHFLKYALKLKEREEFEFSAADIGTILHSAIKAFGDFIRNEDVHALTRNEIESAADAAFDKVYTRSISAVNSPSRSFDELRLRTINRYTAWCMAEQIKRGSFVPWGTEKDFRIEGVHGIVDRIDVCSSEQGNYVRVIDYKSSSKDLKLDQLVYGIQVQLPLYMTAAKELVKPVLGKNAEAAGMYYYGMYDSVMDVDNMDEEVSEESRLRELRLEGISRREQEILQLLDNDLNGPGADSKIIKVKFLKGLDENGGYKPDAYSRTATGDQFKCIEEYTKYILKKFRKKIEGGAAAIDPKEIADSDSCRYCPYASVCGFDEKIPGYKKLRRAAASDEEVLRIMFEKLYGKDSDGN